MLPAFIPKLELVLERTEGKSTQRDSHRYNSSVTRLLPNKSFEDAVDQDYTHPYNRFGMRPVYRPTQGQLHVSFRL